MQTQTFNNFDLGVAVMIEALAGGYAGWRLTHVSFDVDAPEAGNQMIEVKTYGVGKRSDAVAYANLCVADKVPAGTYLRIV